MMGHFKTIVFLSLDIVIALYYGNQENTTPWSTIQSNLTDFFNQINKYKEEGMDVIAGGDFNVHVGSAVRDNEPSVTKGGDLLINLCKDLGLCFLGFRNIKLSQCLD